MIQKLFVIGAGAVGGSISLALKDAGQDICGLYDEDGDRSRRLAQRLGLSPDDTAFGAVARANTVLVAVSEESIKEVARRAAREGLCRREQIWLHTAGARGSDELEPVRGLVAGAGVFHPPYAFASGAVTSVPSGLVFSTGGDDSARARAAELAKALGGTTATVEDDSRTLYHAACVVAANYVTTLLDRACSLLVRIGVEEDIARQLAAQLAESAACQVRRRPAPEALSGPIKRGDLKTVEEHLRALADVPDTQLMYRHLGRLTLELAQAGTSSLSAGEVEALRRVLEQKG